MIVAPERDVPGMSANACAKPILRAWLQRIWSTLSILTVPGLRRCRRSAHRITKAPTTNADATGTGAKRWALIKRLNARPRIAAGRKAMPRLIAKRCDARSEKRPAATPTGLRRYSQPQARRAQ